MRLFCITALLLSSCASTMSAPVPLAGPTEAEVMAAPATYDPSPQGGLDSQRLGAAPGESIVTLGGALTSTSDNTSLTAQLGYGRFLSETNEVGVQVLLFNTDDFTAFNLAPYFNYNHQLTARTWAYAGPHLGILFFDLDVDGPGGGSSTDLSYGVHGGLRHWATPNTSYYVEPRFTSSDSQDEFAILFGLNISLGE